MPEKEKVKDVQALADTLDSLPETVKRCESKVHGNDGQGRLDCLLQRETRLYAAWRENLRGNRETIFAMLAQGYDVPAIAERFGVSKTTMYANLRRWRRL